MYKDSLSPVVHFSSVRPSLTLSVSYNDVDTYIGVSSAVPYGHLPKPLSMTLLKGLAAGRKICKLKKSIYGLGQVPSMWPQHLREH
jgi:Reverse transcriptase (RNA-dependent DNA polymerase)